VSPPCSPKRHRYGDRHPFPEPSFTYPSRSPVKEPPSPRFPSQISQRERDVLFPEPSFIRLSKYLVNEPTPGSPTRSLWKEMPVSRACFYTSPNKNKISRPSKATVKEPLSMTPNGAPMERDAVSRASGLTPWHTQTSVRRPGSLGRLIHSRL